MPVVTPQPTSAADVSGTSSGIFTACTSRMRVWSANTEVMAKLKRGWPSRMNGWYAAPMLWRHDVGRPFMQNSQKPHAATVAITMWSPGFTWVTASPTWATMPAPSCPQTAGVGTG